MTKNIFLNLPVSDLKRTMDFFTGLGFSFNPAFTDETAACLIVGDTIFAMLLTHAKFKQFTKKDIADTKKNAQVLIAIDAESKAKLEELVQKAKDSGGAINTEPIDHGWMYQHGFADPDGHEWELLYIDQSKAPKCNTMENYQLDRAMNVLYVTADSYPAGIEKAHQQLHQLLPSISGRNFFGLSRPENKTIVYKAAVEESYAGEGKALGCETMVIEKGSYISLYIKDYVKHMEHISKAFEVLLADPRIEHNGGYCVEMYVGQNDLRCMVRLKQ